MADKYFIRYKNSNVIHIQEYVQDTIRIIFCQVSRKKKHYPPVIIASNVEIVIASTRWLTEQATLDNSGLYWDTLP